MKQQSTRPLFGKTNVAKLISMGNASKKQMPAIPITNNFALTSIPMQ
jgi:hypothetical protein